MQREVDLFGLCRLAGWQQEPLANKLGVSRSSLSYWQSGKRSIPLARAVALAKILSTPEAPVTTEDIYNAWRVSRERPRHPPAIPDAA
jgi:transcriptional regulator with XRE-family HTH domain